MPPQIASYGSYSLNFSGHLNHICRMCEMKMFKNCAKCTPNRCLENPASWESWETLLNYVFLWINYTSKSYVLETVERGLRNSSYHALLTIVIKALYALSLQICTLLCLWRVWEIKKIQHFWTSGLKMWCKHLDLFGEDASNKF